VKDLFQLKTARRDTFPHLIALFCTVSGKPFTATGLDRFFSMKSTA
jgi:hypothetical protein